MENILNLENLKIAQLGFVYKDVRKQAELMETFFGIPKFIILGPVKLDTNYRGKDTTFTVTGAFTKLSGTYRHRDLSFRVGGHGFIRLSGSFGYRSSSARHHPNHWSGYWRRCRSATGSQAIKTGSWPLDY